jgi:hypothetical protein
VHSLQTDVPTGLAMHVRRKRRALLVLCMGWCSTILTFLYVSHSWQTQISSNTLGHNLTLACNINQVNLYYSNFIRYAMTLNFGEYPICSGNLGPPVPESLSQNHVWLLSGYSEVLDRHHTKIDLCAVCSPWRQECRYPPHVLQFHADVMLSKVKQLHGTNI